MNKEHEKLYFDTQTAIKALCDFEAKQNKQESDGEFIASYINTLSGLSATVLNKLYGVLAEQLPEGAIELNSFLEAFFVTLKRNYSKMYDVKLPDVEL